MTDRYLTADECYDSSMGYLDSDNSALCSACAVESCAEDELPRFRPIAGFTPDPDEVCDQCGALIDPDLSDSDEADDGSDS